MTNKCTYINIPVEPIGKPRMVKSDAWKKRPCVLRYWEYKKIIQSHISKYNFSGFNYVELFAYISMPKSWSNKKKNSMLGQYHAQKPDIDNIAKGVFDCIFEEDSHISKCKIEKRWEDGDGARLELWLNKI